MMERLFNNGNEHIKRQTLKLQFRMREDLAQFTRLFYCEYQTDRARTQQNEKLPFIPSSFFWVSNPSHVEEMDTETQSFVNHEEAKVPTDQYLISSYFHIILLLVSII